MTVTPKDQEPRSLVEAIGRGLDLLTSPTGLREMRLEVQIVYFAFHMPVVRGVTLHIPVLTMVKPIRSWSVDRSHGYSEQDNND